MCACAAACGIFARLLLAPGSPDLALAFFRRAPPPLQHAAAAAGLPNGGAPQDLASFQAPGGGGQDAALLAFVDLWLDRCDSWLRAAQPCYKSGQPCYKSSR